MESDSLNKGALTERMNSADASALERVSEQESSCHSLPLVVSPRDSLSECALTERMNSADASALERVSEHESSCHSLPLDVSLRNRRMTRLQSITENVGQQTSKLIRNLQKTTGVLGSSIFFVLMMFAVSGLGGLVLHVLEREPERQRRESYLLALNSTKLDAATIQKLVHFGLQDPTLAYEDFSMYAACCRASLGPCVLGNFRRRGRGSASTSSNGAIERGGGR